MKRPATIYSLRLIALTIALVACLCSYLFFAQHHAAAIVAAADFYDCRQLAAEIHQLRDRPSLAGVEEVRMAELTSLIETATRQSKIPAEALVRVVPNQPQRISESAYQEQNTQLLFRGVTLKQFTDFLCQLVHEQATLRASQIRLVAPREKEEGATWTVEATISYLIYAPRATPNRQSGEPS